LVGQSAIYKRKGPGKILCAFVFIASFLWFYFPAEYVLIANQDRSLFLINTGYLLSFLDRPGGFMEYLGSFLSQFLRFRLAGALVLSGLICSVYIAVGHLLKRISGRGGLQMIGLVTPLLLLGMHNYYPHQISHSLGFVFAIVLAVLVPGGKGWRSLFLVIAVPLYYFISGGYVWFFCGLVLAEGLMNRRKEDLTTLLLTTVYPFFVIVCGALLLYLDPLLELLTIGLPVGQTYGVAPWPYLFTAWVVLLMIFSRIQGSGQRLQPVWRNPAESVLFLVAAILVLHFSFNRKNADFFTIEKLAIEEDWNGLLEYSAQHPSRNLFGSYYTNLALVNTGSLCSGLFQYPQAFGRRALCFEWEAKGEILRRGSDFFWTVFFVNEAHHWAFESMIIDGFTRRNLRRLIQTELVRGNMQLAEKYIRLLRKALFHKKMADHYAQFLNKPEVLENDPELGPRMKSGMKKDFFSEGLDLKKNLKSLLANKPSNAPACDYLMALLLLEKEVDEIAIFLPDYLLAKGGKMPVLLDESLLVYKISHKEDLVPDIRVSSSTLRRFDEYTRILRQYRNPDDAARMLYPAYRSSFWFYLNFTPLTNYQE
jgi:Family of unknown function (DUF6057)